MSETPSQKDYEKVTFLIVVKKIKRFRLFEPSLSILGFFLVICLVLLFALLDYRSVAKVLKFSSESQKRFSWLRFDRPIYERKKIDFLSENGGVCDVFDGDWIWDDSYPLYNSRDCKFLDEGFRCTENGRPDLFYTKWRWQPKACNLPRFLSKVLIAILYLKFLVHTSSCSNVFVGLHTLCPSDIPRFTLWNCFLLLFTKVCFVFCVYLYLQRVLEKPSIGHINVFLIKFAFVICPIFLVYSYVYFPA